MSFAEFGFVASIVQTGLFLLLFVLLRYHGTHRIFRIYYLYLGTDLVVGLISRVVTGVHGFGSGQHILYYDLAGIATTTLQVWAVFELAQILSVRRADWIWALMPITLMVLLLGVKAPGTVFEISTLARTILLHLGLYGVLAAMVGMLSRRRHVRIGRNFKGILWYLVIAQIAQWGLYWSYAVGGLAYDVLRWSIQPCFITGSLIAVWHLRFADLPVAVPSRVKGVNASA